ncbi:PH domain-containing protein [Halobaculum magnesiiphilum]|uniref:PH domain-containing protein n=1 Tax=Halobaculum magnesiiphilum TaxID=1017351 RepID=A0A8T8WEE4_9EURY|nr:PH domain-containing protein [Halobaculum magnesiiphilum]QZP38113.1 PH domain-containing protein [Halobaculum magnesiiphilum]
MTADAEPDGVVTDWAVPASVTVDDDEVVRWTGRPRLSAAAPAGLVGLLVAGGGMAVAVGPAATSRFGLAIAALAVLVGLAIPGVAVLSLVNTRYVLTDRAASVKTGIVGRRVARARLSMAENTAYEQSVTGSLFGYGTVKLETAGGDLAFRRVDDPQAVRSLVDEHTRSGRKGETESIPGSIDSWRAVREEVGRLRAALDR